MVVADVNCAKVPVFIDEEVQNVDSMKDVGNRHRIGNISMDLVLIGRKRKISKRKRRVSKTLIRCLSQRHLKTLIRENVLRRLLSCFEVNLPGVLPPSAGNSLINKFYLAQKGISIKNHEKYQTYISVQAIIPGRPLWNSLKSQYCPKRGLNSIPM